MIIKEIQTKGIMTKSNLPVADFSVNPYVGCAHACQYCYASFMKRFANHPEPWGDFVDVKVWPDIKNPGKYAGKEAFLGSVTDCYQPCEAKYKRTRALLEQLQGSGISISIATKSDLVLRDLDLLKTFKRVTVSWSVNTLDEQFKDAMDDAPSIERRLAAMKEVYESGIRTVCFVSPIFPGITDVLAIIERVKDFTDLIWLENLNLRGQFKPTIMQYIRKEHPGLVELYNDIYTRKRRDHWQTLALQVEAYTKEHQMPYVVNDLPYGRSEHGHPVVVNYFYHEEIRLNR